MHKAIFIGSQPIPLNQYIEHSQGKSQTGLEVFPNSVHDFFEVVNQGQHRKHGFDQHPIVPSASFTDLEIRWIPFFGMESLICQDNYDLFIAFDQRLEGRVMNMGRIPIPGYDLSELVEDQAEFAAYNPAIIGLAFLADLVFGSSFPNGVDQFDTVRDTMRRARTTTPSRVGDARNRSVPSP